MTTTTLLLCVLRLSLCLNRTVAAPSTSARPDPTPVAVAERRLGAMGTLLSLRIEGRNRADALAASEAAAAEVARAEDLLSTWKPGGPLDRLNRAGPGETIEVGPEVAAILAGLREWTARTGGAFDPTCLPLIRAWDLRGRGRIPGAEELLRASSATGWRGFELSPAAGVAARLRADAGIDEGAWGKGYSLDLAAEALRRTGILRGTLDLGGQVLAIGPASIGISDPRDRRRIAGSLEVEDVSVSTSGNSERRRTARGRSIGHLLDPRTGRPASDFGSATAVARSAFAADILSTAFFVLGPEEGLALSRRLSRNGFANEALFLIAGPGRPTVVASPGLRFQPSRDR